jgi:hypothetical protein
MAGGTDRREIRGPSQRSTDSLSRHHPLGVPMLLVKLGGALREQPDRRAINLTAELLALQAQ